MKKNIGLASFASIFSVLGFASVANAQTPPSEADLNAIAHRRHVGPVLLDTTPPWLAAPANSCVRWQMAARASAAEAAANSDSCSAAATDAQAAIDGATAVCGQAMAGLQGQLDQCRAARPATPASPNRGPRVVDMPNCHPELGGAALVCVTDDHRVLHGTEACASVPRAHIRRATCECPAGSEPTRIAGARRDVYCATVFHGVRVAPPGIERVDTSSITTRLTNLETRVDQICSHAVTPAPAAASDEPAAPADPNAPPAPQPTSDNCEEMMLGLWRAITANAGGHPTDLGPLESRMNVVEADLREVHVTLRQHGEGIGRLDRRLNVDILAGGFANPRFNGHTSFGGLAGLRVELGLVDRLRLYVEGDIGYALFNGIGVPTTAIYGGVAGMRLFVSDSFSLTFGFRAMMYVENGSQPANEAAVGSFRGDYYGGEAGFRYAFSPNWAINAAIGIGDGHAVMVSSPMSLHRGTAVDIESLGAMITAGISWRPL